MSAGQESPARKRRDQALLLLAAFVVLDLLTPGVMVSTRSDIAAAMVIGGVAGQLAVLAVWGVVGPQRPAVRWPLALGLTAALYLVLFVGGLATGDNDPDFPRGLLMLPLLPLVFLAVQLPVWVLKLATGCRMVLDEGQGALPAPRSRQFRLQDLLVATTLVAVALGLARLGLSGLGNSSGSQVSQNVAALALICGVVAVWSGAVTVPSLFGALVARNPAQWIVVMLVYTPLVSVVPLLITVVLSGPGGPGPIFGFLLFFNGSLVTVLFGSLLIARAYGYTLLWPRRKAGDPSPPPPDSPSSERPSPPSPPPSEPPPQ